MSNHINYKQLFVDIALSKNYKIIKPNFHQKKHNIDFILEGQINQKTINVSIDLKKKNGKNANHWVYIEYDNSKGGKGWIHGNADFIVFETNDQFIFIPRKKLLNYLNQSQIIRWDLPYVDKPWNAKYRLFRRKNTLETISQIKVKDLLNVTGYQIWNKNEQNKK